MRTLKNSFGTLSRTLSFLSFLFLSSCISGGNGNFFLVGPDGQVISEIKYKPIGTFHSGSAADITNDSDYDLYVITMYISEHGYWHRENYFIVPAGHKGYASIPAPGYVNWGTCGVATITIRVQVNNRIYSSAEKISVCNWQPILPVYIISNETIKRRMEGNGEIWNKAGWGY